MKICIRKKCWSPTLEDILVGALGMSFFVGVWYAFPMVNTVVDVWAFGGGVLRAMEAHTILPGSDVSYGTLSFFQNYIAMAVALGVGFLFTGFDIEALRTLLILNPSYTLIPARIVSVLTTIVFLLIIYRFLLRHVTSSWWRYTLLILTFGNVLTALLARSGKMWMLSTMLGVVSFMYLYRALSEEVRGGVPERHTIVSVVSAFLATANFPFAAVFLVNIPILVFYMKKTRESIIRLCMIVLLGSAVFFGVVLLNFSNTVGLVWSFITPFFTAPSSATHALSFFEALLVNLRQAFEAFPLLFIGAVFVAVVMRGSSLRDRTLAYLACIYSAVYILVASVVFRADHGLALNVRHMFPLAFFLLFFIVAHRAPLRYVSVAFLSLAIPLYLYTLVLLSVPTTYNQTAEFIETTYGDTPVRIDEYVLELTLPMNRASYEIYKEEHCGSTCTHRRSLGTDIAFRPLVVTGESDESLFATLPPPHIAIHELSIPGCTPIARFGNEVPDTAIFDMDINLGRMLMPSFYELKRLGKNIYIYDVATCPSAGDPALLSRKTHYF